jgi:hypothetical protein
MLIFAAATGDLDGLREWGRQGVRVATGRPLISATFREFIEVMRCLVKELGTDVSQIYDGDTPLAVAATNGFSNLVRLLVTEFGADIDQDSPQVGTPLSMAAHRGHLPVVRCLVELGANIEAVDEDSDTALLMSAHNGCYAKMQYLLEETGANVDDVNNNGKTVWNLLSGHLDPLAVPLGSDEDPVGLTALLRVLVLRGAPPPALVALLSPEHARVVQEGAWL